MPCPSLVRAWVPTHLMRPLTLCASSLTNKRLACFFALHCVAAIVRYNSRLKNGCKATGPGIIPLKVNKFALNITNSYLFNLIVKDLEKKYSEEPKTALVRPICKKNKRNKIGNYKLISILNGTSKIYERYIYNNLSS